MVEALTHWTEPEPEVLRALLQLPRDLPAVGPDEAGVRLAHLTPAQYVVGEVAVHLEHGSIERGRVIS